jgi:cardiolipin synthase
MPDPRPAAPSAAGASSPAQPADQGKRAGGGRRQGEDRILTVPNALTVIRLGCLPLFVWLIARPDRAGWYPAALLLAGLGITDGLDGYVARHFHQVSNLGKVLDPIADRLLLATAAISIIVVGALPIWVAVVALVREAVVAGGFMAVAALGGRRMDVQWAGKAGTFGLMCALPLFLAGHAHDDWHSVAEVLAWVAVIPGLVLGWYAVVTYVPRARAVLAEAKLLANQEAST